MSEVKMSHSAVALKQWDKLQHLLSSRPSTIEIDGKSLDIPSLVATARHGVDVCLSGACLASVDKSAAFFDHCLAEGHSIYGVNTGFGGSADTRTNNTKELQSSLIDFLNCGITVIGSAGQADAASTSTIPESWVRSSMAVRANSLARGHSGVRSVVIDGLVNLLNNDLVPLIPLRGSISASGDLIPLSYIAGALQGKGNIYVWANTRSTHLSNSQDGLKWVKGQITPPTPSSPDDPSDTVSITGAKLMHAARPSKITQTTAEKRGSISIFKKHPRHIAPACDALAEHDLAQLKLAPKEGLSLVNGTAVSAGTGALAVHEAQNIALLAEVLTAMSVEALTGTTESFDPFIGNVRPHPGQVEAARNILRFLQGSSLARKGDSDGVEDQGGLRQDRYSLRTIPQWIGPQLENLTLAYQQVEIECNSTTDNPLLDSERKKVLHGGNFQALAVTSAMEKVRQSLQQLGRMLFIQCSEIVNPVFSNGLPPNLETGEPSQGFLMKGVDISTAALCSELGYLANPITPHVQTAEMGNQSLNSMAFVSTRYTHTALDVISQLAAAHIFVVCQALDLRCIQKKFYTLFIPKLWTITTEILSKHINEVELPRLIQDLSSKFQDEFIRTTSQDSTERLYNILKSLWSVVLSVPGLQNTPTLFENLSQWTLNSATEASQLHKDCVASYIVQPLAPDYLGAAAFRIWDFVRHEVKVPFHTGKGGFWNALNEDEDLSVGEMVSRIYLAIKEGGMTGVVMECVREAHAFEAENTDQSRFMTELKI